MTATEWEWQDGSGGAPHLQRTALHDVPPTQAAYDTYIAHIRRCQECGPSRCEQGERLCQAYLETARTAGPLDSAREVR